MSAREDLRDAAVMFAAAIRKRGVWQTAKRLAEYALTLPENREALLAKRAKEEAEEQCP